MPEHNPGQMGGTMRLGKRRTIFKSNTSVLSEWCPFAACREIIINECPRFLKRVIAGCIWADFIIGFLFEGKLYGDVEYVDERHRHRFEVRGRRS